MVTVKGEVATVMAAVAMVTEGVAGNERLSEAQSLTASGSYVETLETAHRDQAGWRWAVTETAANMATPPESCTCRDFYKRQ